MEFLCCSSSCLECATKPCSFTIHQLWVVLSGKTEWRLISATLCGWRRCFVADQLRFITRIREEEVVDSLELGLKTLTVNWFTIWYMKIQTQQHTDQIFSASEADSHQFSNPLILVKLCAWRVWNVEIVTTASVNICLSITVAHITTSVSSNIR